MSRYRGRPRYGRSVIAQFPPIEAPSPAAVGRADPADPAAAAPPDLNAAGALRPLLELGPPGVVGWPARARLVVFAADHGILAVGVSADAGAATGHRLAELDIGAGPVAAAADRAGVRIRTVDLRELLPDPAPVARHAAVEDVADLWAGHRASGRIDVEDALTDDEVGRALQRGRDAADTEVDEGADLLLAGVCSAGVSTPAAVLSAAITGIEPVDATSRGSGIDDAGWIRKVAAVRDALYRTRLGGTDTAGLLRVGGGADLAALTGFLAQAAVRRTPVLIDDLAGTVCAVLAQRLAPGADDWIFVAAPVADRGHRRLLDVLDRPPLTGLDVRLPSGAAAALVVSLLRGVADVVAQLPAGPPLWDETLL